MTTKTWASLAALAIGLAASPAQSADLGGNCCADLEERIAELEATTARKGNRKVSLEIGGQVNQAFMAWDDGADEDVYGVTNDNARTRFRFRGKAKISPDLEAGYALEVGVRTSRSNRFTQTDPDVGSGLDLRDSYWFLKSKTYGGVSVGFQGHATDAITESNLSQTKDFAKLSDMEDTGLGLFMRSSANGRLSSSLQFFEMLGSAGDQPGDGDRKQNAVKYESREFAGFTLSASYSTVEFGDVALRYAGEHAGFKFIAGIGYGKQNGTSTGVACNAAFGTQQECEQFGGSFSIMHQDTGLFLSMGAGTKTDEKINDQAVFATTGADDRQDFWSLQAGIERKWLPLGKTTVFGEYFDYEGGSNSRTGQSIASNDALDPIADGNAAIILDNGLEAYGFGIAQGIDAAAMVLYLHYRHVEVDLTTAQVVGGVAAPGTVRGVGVDDLDIITAGGIIKF